MRRKIMLKEVISVVKLSLFPVWCWPLSKDATRFKMSCMKLYHYLCIIMSLALGAALLYGISNHLNDPIVLVQQILLTGGVFHACFNFIFYRLNYHHIQNVTLEMEHFADFMKPHEEVIIQRYINKCILYHGICLFLFYFTTVAAISIIPTIMHESFPTPAEYPFDVYHQPLRFIIYVHQSIVGIIITGQLCMNILMALLLWFASAKFEILCEELRSITNVHQLYNCIKKHQELLKYAVEIAVPARTFALTTVCCSMVGIIIVFLLFITHQPIAMILQFSGMALTGLSEIFMFSWPAEHLIFMSKDVGQTAFEILKDNHSIEIWKLLQIIIMRSQKPATVTIPFFRVALSFTYFTSYCSTILSYFTTLRVIMDDY